LRTDEHSVDECVATILAELEGIVNPLEK
jgi:hypothetical protein